MIVLKHIVRDQLSNAPGAWLTVAQLVALIPQAQGRDETVARALRKLRAEGQVAAQPVPGNARYRQWSYTSSRVSRIAARASQQASNAPQAPTSSPSSPSRRNSMSTFQTAIETVITDFVVAQKTFSAFEVTKELRERSNVGTVVIDKAETGSAHVNGIDVPRIEHDKVKAEVHDLFTQGKMAGYDRSNNGQYWQYGPAAAPPVDPAASSGGGSPPPIDGSSYDGSSSL